VDDTVFVAVHAVAATVAFAAGVLALPAGRFLAAHRAGLLVMTLALVPAVLVDAAATGSAGLAVFGALLVLAVVMVVRAELAARRPPAATGGPTPAYVEHVGFTLISLAVGFVVVAVLRLGAPGWLAAAAGVGVVLTGRVAVAAARRRWVRPAPSPLATG
jgi:hypothetical protein